MLKNKPDSYGEESLSGRRVFRDLPKAMLIKTRLWWNSRTDCLGLRAWNTIGGWKRDDRVAVEFIRHNADLIVCGQGVCCESSFFLLKCSTDSLGRSGAPRLSRNTLLAVPITSPQSRNSQLSGWLKWWLRSYAWTSVKFCDPILRWPLVVTKWSPECPERSEPFSTDTEWMNKWRL